MAITKENDNTPAIEASSEADQLRDELQRERDMRLRALADFDNYRKRAERDLTGAAERGKRDIVMQLLDLVDNFDRAFQHTGESPAAWIEGVQSIHRKLLALLKAQGITPFESLGQPFDPERHEAVSALDSDDYESGTVAEEVQRGYRWGDALLRPARVRVAR
jgi:molecular chaperone GrpE